MFTVHWGINETDIMILNVICNDPHILSQGRHNLEDFTEKTTIWIFRLLTCLTKKLRPKPRATKTTILTLRKYHRDLSRRPTQLSRLALSASHRTVGAIVSIEGSQVDRSLVQWILSSLSSSSDSFTRYTSTTGASRCVNPGMLIFLPFSFCMGV